MKIATLIISAAFGIILTTTVFAEQAQTANITVEQQASAEPCDHLDDDSLTEQEKQELCKLESAPVTECKQVSCD